MPLLRSRPSILWALGLGLAALVLLPLSHLGLDHAEDCPLCHPGSHAFQTPNGVQTLDDLPRRAEVWATRPSAFLLSTRVQLLPPGRAPPLLPAA